MNISSKLYSSTAKYRNKDTHAICKMKRCNNIYFFVINTCDYKSTTECIRYRNYLERI